MVEVAESDDAEGTPLYTPRGIYNIIVFLKKTAMVDDEEPHLLRGVQFPSLVEKPPCITPAGLSLERHTYLYKKIREYFQANGQDLVCPNPSLHHHQPDAQPKATPAKHPQH